MAGPPPAPPVSVHSAATATAQPLRRCPPNAVSPSATLDVLPVQHEHGQEGARRGLPRQVLGDRGDRRVGELVEVEALVVAVGSPRRGVVEQLLQGGVGHRGDELEQRRQRRLGTGRAPRRAPPRCRSRPRSGRCRRRTWCCSGTNGAGGAVSPAATITPVRWGIVGMRSRISREGLRAAPELPEQQPDVHVRADRVQPEGERGDHAEVAATAAQRPEQVRVLARPRCAACDRRR